MASNDISRPGTPNPDLFKFLKKLGNSSVPCLVDFYADWCGPCRRMNPVVEEIEKEFQGKLLVIKVNTDNNPEIANHYGILGIPTFIFFRAGIEVWRITEANPAGLLNKIKESLEKPF